MRVGVDIVQSSRLRTAVQDPDFVRAVFSDLEQDICGGDAMRLAGRWAAKEAVVKALGLEIGSITLCSLEIRNSPAGEPQAFLANRPVHVALSIAHDGDYAIAFAVATGLQDAG